MKYNYLIKNKLRLKLSSQKLNEQIDVVYCIDNNYSLAAGVSIHSLMKNNKDINISIHLFVLSLSEVNRTKFFDAISTNDHVSLTIYYINDEININKNNKTKLPLSASLRIITPEILKEECATIIYIDSDTLITKNLIDLLHINSFENTIISAVVDIESEKHAKRLVFPTRKYFNSGVMVINTKKWCDSNITKKALELLSDKNFLIPDQDVLNILLYNNIHYISCKYNVQFELSNYEKDGDVLNTESLIIHYLGVDKPWFRLFMTERYKKELEQTPWCKDKLKLVPNISRIRVYSKRIKNFSKIKSIKLLLLYFLCKIMV
ncbi:glycosyltransferase family 8 protein [Orbus sturtevantii]|uniref:glycosyltransferase family 8 protein n=1 Tax=Orbus sturtevantii TaxID=3074109 RepID=UPI00370DCD1B